jgi:hypothetical protein
MERERTLLEAVAERWSDVATMVDEAGEGR